MSDKYQGTEYAAQLEFSADYPDEYKEHVRQRAILDAAADLVRDALKTRAWTVIRLQEEHDPPEPYWHLLSPWDTIKYIMRIKFGRVETARPIVVPEYTEPLLALPATPPVKAKPKREPNPKPVKLSEPRVSPLALAFALLALMALVVLL